MIWSDGVLVEWQVALVDVDFGQRLDFRQKSLSPLFGLPLATVFVGDLRHVAHALVNWGQLGSHLLHFLAVLLQSKTSSSYLQLESEFLESVNTQNLNEIALVFVLFHIVTQSLIFLEMSRWHFLPADQPDFLVNWIELYEGEQRKAIVFFIVEESS